MLDDVLHESGRRPMKVEIHCHTDRYSPCSQIPPRELVAMAEASGYDALFITDHHKVWDPTELAALQEQSSRVRLFSGIEITLADRVDILVLGANDPIYETLKTPDAVFAQAAVDGYATIVAHPFRWMDELPPYCALADAVETRTCNHGQENWIQSALRYSMEHHMTTVYSSDAHGLNFMNKFWIETFDTFETPQDFRRAIVSEKFSNRSRDFAMALPPPTKVASMNDLSDEDQTALGVTTAS